MLARIQQFTTLAIFTIALACAAFLVSLGEPKWAAVAFASMLSGHAVFLAVEFVWLARVNRTEPVPAATLPEVALAWWREVLTAAQVFAWQQPMRSQTHPDHMPPEAAGRVGIVLVHGFVCNRGLWNPWLTEFRRLGIPFVAVNLEPVFGSIDDYAPIVEQAVHRMEVATGTRPLIVAHSMGGLAVRAWLDRYRADVRTSHVITIGTPHRGTALARFAFMPNARQMQIQSKWQQAMARREPGGRYANFTCFYSHCDNVVFPATTAMLPGADNRHLRGVAHVCMARHETVLCEVLRRAGNAELPLQRVLTRQG